MQPSIEILETGRIRIRPSHRTQTADRPVLLRRARVLLDRQWTEPLPINTYLIHHDKGPILFDTGESPHATEPGWLPRWQPFFQMSVDISVKPEESIGSRLAHKGLGASDLQAILISHLHHDHGDGIGELAGGNFMVTDEHWAAFKPSIAATIEGAVPQHWPKNFQPRQLKLTGPAIGPWKKTYPITTDGTVVGVPTPGHVPGHLSALVFAEEATYLLGGDVTYDQLLLDQELTDGVNKDPHRAVQTLREIKEYCRDNNVVLLPAHDPQAARRLAHREFFRPTFL